MKKQILKRSLSMILAIVMVVIMMPVVVFAETESNDLPAEFKITSREGKVTYSSAIANMTYDFYIAARQYIDTNAEDDPEEEAQKGSLSFVTNGISYDLSSVYAYKPARRIWNNTCGALTGILNYDVKENGVEKTKHIVLIAFRGTDGLDDIMTDLDFQDEIGYHNGFFKTARNHYNHMISNVSYDLGNGNDISFGEYVKKMKEGDPDYTMIVTGHSLGGAVANIFTSYHLRNKGNVKNTNVVAYTYGSPCTCSKKIYTDNKVDNVFNFINAYDWVPKVGYGGVDEMIYLNPAVKDSGYRQGIDFVFAEGKSGYGSRVPFSFTNHHMKIYKKIKDRVNNYINENYSNEPPIADNLISGSKFEYSKKEKGISEFLDLYKPMFNSRVSALEAALSGDSLHNIVTKAITSFFGIEIQSETDKALERIEDQLWLISEDINEISQRLEEIEKSIKEIQVNLTKIKDEIINKIDNIAYENRLNSFIAGDSGDATDGYHYYTETLRRSYHNFLCQLNELEKIKIEKPSEILKQEEKVKKCYEILYSDATKVSNLLYDNMHPLDTNIEGVAYNVPSIQDIFFEYIHNSQNSISKDELEKYETFIMELYATYTYSEYCRMICFAYKLAWCDLNDTTSYDIEHIETIKDMWENSINNQNKMLEEITAFEAKVYKNIMETDILYNIAIVDTELLLSSNESKLFYIPKLMSLSSSEIYVNANDVLCLRDVANEIYLTSLETQLNWFNNLEAFSYYVSDSSLAKVTNDGILIVADTAKQGKSFEVTLSYLPNAKSNQVALKTWKFTIGKKEQPWYGDGTEESPFIISTKKDLEAISTAVNKDGKKYAEIPNSHFLLVNDIDFEGSKLDSIILFAGIFDGNGCSIYGFDLNHPVREWTNVDAFHKVGFVECNVGTIKNLTIGCSDKTYFTVDTKAVSTKIYNCATETFYNTYTGGALVGHNLGGTIENCHIVNTFVGGTLQDTNDNESLYCVVGGLVGINYGSITSCSVSNSYIKSYGQANIENSGDDNYAYSGGVVGKIATGGEIDNCLSLNNEIKAYAEGNGKKDQSSTSSITGNKTKHNWAYPCSKAGGLTTEINSGGIIKNSIAINNNLYSNVYPTLNDNYTNLDRAYKNNLICDTWGTKENCVTDSDIANFSTNDKWISNDTELSLNNYTDISACLNKTEYCVGEIFDPSAIWIYLVDERGAVSEEAYSHFVYEIDPLSDIGEYTLKIRTYGGITKELTVAVVPHSYDDFVQFDVEHHIKRCSCGEKEYAAHDWDDGVETLAPTYTTEGEKTYTCGDCGATKIEKLPIWDMPEDAPKVIVSSKNAVVGGTVQIAISIENNPGIWSMAFELPIDTDVFEFVSDDKSASIFKQFGICGYDANKNVYKFNGYNGDLMNNITADGTLVVITLKVKETAEVGTYKLCTMLSERDIVNVDENMVSFASIDGTIEVPEYILGDVNGDGYITNADVLKIFRYIYNPAIYPLTEEVADVNRDGYVTNADVLKIFRYIYNPELYPIG